MKSTFIILLFIFCRMLCCGQELELKFDHITSEDGLPQNTIHGIVKDKYGFMWFGTWSGLCRFDGYKFKIYRYEPGNPKSINNNRVHNIIEDDKHDLWIQTFDKSIVCRYNFETDDFEQFPRAKLSSPFMKMLNRWDHYHHIKPTYKNYQWYIDPYTNSLVQTYIPTGKKTILSSNAVSRWALNDADVSDIYLDEHHILWVGTYDNGINKANLNAKPFDYFYHNPLNRNSIIDNNVRAICEDKSGNFWIGTRNKGITIIHKDQTYQHLQYDLNNRNTINNDQVRKIFCDSRGWLWIGTKQGLDRYDLASGKVNHYEMLGLKKIAVFDIMEDHSGNLWLATWKGIYKYKVKEDTWLHFDPKILPEPHARVIIEDHKGQLWVGTDGGGISIFKVNDKSELMVVKRFVHNGQSTNSLSDGRIYGMIEDASHFIWIGTGNGLDRLDPEKSSFRHFSVTKDPSTDESIAAILEDDKGYVWISHKKGLSQFNKQTFAVINYSLQDGLQSNEFEEAAAFRSPTTGRLYFGGNNGYNGFDPKLMIPDRNLPKVVFTELQILNKPVEPNQKVNDRVILKRPIHLTKEIELTHRDKSIALEFSALQYANPAGNKYAYMLDGFDKNWIYTDASRRFATYSNLNPGDYTFKVKASNSEGVWNPVPATLKITVIPAFWASMWAYLFYILVFVGMLYLFYYYSARYTRLKSKLSFESLIHEKELELQKSKIEFFTNISHEIKTPLSLILAPIERLALMAKTDTAANKELSTMKNNGDRLLKLINQLLDIRRFETGNDKLTLETKDLVGFVQMIIESFQQLALQRQIKLVLTAPGEAFYIRFDPDKVEKILYNLLSNSFKFTPANGLIQVKVITIQTTWPDVAIIEVIDNGCGILPADLERIFKPFQQGYLNKAGGTGLGLAYSKALAELHGGSISVQSMLGSGAKNQTCFTLKLPCNYFKETFTDSKPQTKPFMEDPLLINHEHALFNSPSADGSIPTILLVEDNFDMRKYLKDYLAEHYRVLEAQHGLEGVEMARKHFPDLLISDVMMPEMDGIELCRRLKSDVLTSHIPVILLTARTPVEYQIEGLETGADEYIVKPFNLTLLSLKIQNLLATRVKLRERYKAQVNIEPSSFTPISPDEKLLKKLLNYIEERIADPDLNIEDICETIGLSRTNLYRKMKALTGLSMAECIKELRLKRARQLLKDRKFNVNEICYMVGFTDADYFRKCFKATFGVSPSEYAKQSAEIRNVNENAG